MKNKRIIKKNFEFQEIIAIKKSLKNFCFVIYFRPNNKNYLRYGISVGKKIGNATLRNKIKRQVRVIIRNSLNNFGDLSVDMIVLVKKSILETSFNNANASMNKLLENIKVI